MGKVIRAVLTTAASQKRKGPWQPNQDASEGETLTFSTFSTGGVPTSARLRPRPVSQRLGLRRPPGRIAKLTGGLTRQDDQPRTTDKASGAETGMRQRNQSG